MWRRWAGIRTEADFSLRSWVRRLRSAAGRCRCRRWHLPPGRWQPGHTLPPSPSGPAAVPEERLSEGDLCSCSSFRCDFHSSPGISLPLWWRRRHQATVLLTPPTEVSSRCLERCCRRKWGRLRCGMTLAWPPFPAADSPVHSDLMRALVHRHRLCHGDYRPLVDKRHHYSRSGTSQKTDCVSCCFCKINILLNFLI